MKTPKAKSENFSEVENGNAPQTRLRPPGDKYQRILDAAFSVFAAKGFHAARISDVADRADVADGTIYLYFRNKEELLMTAILTAFDAFMGRARAELERIASPADKLRRLGELHLEVLGSNRDMAAVFQMELRQSSRLLGAFSRQHMVEYHQVVRAAIRQGQEEGIFRPELPDKIAANCFFGALDEMVTSWVLDENHYHLPESAGIAVEIILSGLKSQPRS